MRQTKLIGLVIATALGVAVLAAELKRIQVPISKGASQLVVVMSDKEVIAEVKVMKPGTLDLEAAGDITWHILPGGKMDYKCSGGSKLELLADGKSVLTLSGDTMYIKDGEQNFKIK